MTAPAAPISADQLAEWRKLADAATLAPWEWDGAKPDIWGERDVLYVPQGSTIGGTLVQLADTYEGSENDCAFIAAAREAVPALLYEVERLLAELDACQLAVAIQEVRRDSESYRADELNNKMVDEHERADTAETALATMTAAHQERCEKVRELQDECDAWIARNERLRRVIGELRQKWQEIDYSGAAEFETRIDAALAPPAAGQDAAGSGQATGGAGG